jgi:xylulokinase
MPGPYLIACDLGTGGNKASLYDAAGACLAGCFVAYETLYPQPGWHEQRPEDWWQAVVQSMRRLLAETAIDPEEIAGCAISGHSLGVVPLDAHGRLLRASTPIWSDGRATGEARELFTRLSELEWYRRTGNGFPAALYPVCKLMWYRRHEPAMLERAAAILGTKDYINYRLTGRMVTDVSYASGAGVYDLRANRYDEALIAASGLARGLFPEVVPSTEVIGTLTAEAAAALGLPRRLKVIAGGVDNACMALGAGVCEEGQTYQSLGSSSWIAVSSSQPVLDDRSRSFVFTHVVPGQYVSATGIFAAGSSLRWVRDTICGDLIRRAADEGCDIYDLMTEAAAQSVVGANGLLFNPSLAGGSSLDASPLVRGAFLGLDLCHTRADMIRAALEGVALSQRLALDRLRALTRLGDSMVMVGGGSRSPFWRQVTADIYNMRIVKTNIDQQSAALGAAAVAAVGAGVWPDFKPLRQIHQVEDVRPPDPANAGYYERLLPVFERAAVDLAQMGQALEPLRLAYHGH